MRLKSLVRVRVGLTDTKAKRFHCIIKWQQCSGGSCDRHSLVSSRRQGNNYYLMFILE